MSPQSLRLFGPVLLLALLLILACDGGSSTGGPDTSAGSSSAVSESKINVATTNNIIADWVVAVGQDRVEVNALLPVDADAHTYQPGARDITRIADADVVMIVGLSLEASWLDKLIDNAAQDPDRVIALGDAVDPLEFVELTEEDHEEEGHDEGSLDPHFWFDPLRVKLAVNSIATHLSDLDPSRETFYQENATSYAGKLDELHDWIEEKVATLTESQRQLVTSHDSFQYYAERYGFKVVGAILPVTTESEPTAQELTELIETIKSEGAKAVFTERSESDRMARRISEETGAELIGGLYSGSLGEPESKAGTYIDLMRHNTTTIVEALH